MNWLKIGILAVLFSFKDNSFLKAKWNRQFIYLGFICTFLVAISCIKVEPIFIDKGNWGGAKPDQNTSLTIEETRAYFDFTCAAAYIDEDLSKETNSSFSKSGIYFIQRPILPENYDINKDRHEAKFDFVLSNNLLKVTIFDKTANQKIGVFEYQKGLDRMVFKCP
jgi:hypothetical protein